ncbi:GTP cyclohydrolase FolE2 [Jannaschia sp. LMIT008]|uniref:GTP cyclohydrolase FolE2 n=1 Tax=Jannaschia maritima TaxID=3032585 RepID=UPI00281147DD|nr:GTP cyclohydrolase FolE2 [Jannaschia sp. LMIT008]
MTVHASGLDRDPTLADAQAAMDVLRRYRARAGAAAAPAPDLYPDLAASYDAGHVADAAYRATLPDLQNAPAATIRGTDRRIQHVGVAGFRTPLTLPLRAGPRPVDAHVSGTVSLEAGTKGINMSRILRTFQAGPGILDFASVEGVLRAYLADLAAVDARLLIRFQVPLPVSALRSGLTGWQYYDAALEVVRDGGARHRVLHLDYVYASTCPCSLELSEHARRTRGVLATPHSQRSVARLSLQVTGAVGVEDVIEMCRAQVPTETQVMVKREDEQAFAELNAANPIFVEDAVRLFAQGLDGMEGVGDFRVVASHQESLHSHDAVSVLTSGALFEAPTLEPGLFGTLVHGG